MNKFSTTKMVFEIEVETQFGAESAIGLVKNMLDPDLIYAVKKVECISAKTNYVLHGEPSLNFVEVDLKKIK